MNEYEAVVAGVSAGGMETLPELLTPLPPDFSLPVIIVQHLHSNSDGYLISYLNRCCQLGVEEICDKQPVRPGRIYLAPPNYHVLLEKDRTFALDVSEKVNHARPSIDVLFESAADIYGAGLIGIILTGANHDGSMGLRYVKEKGGLAIVQVPHTARVDTMPKGALAATAVDFILPPAAIAEFLINLNLKREMQRTSEHG